MSGVGEGAPVADGRPEGPSLPDRPGEVERELEPDSPQTPTGPPRTVIPRWVQLVLLPLALLALWALAKAAGKVLLIFVVAAVIALILNPAVSFVQHPRVPRGLAVLVVYLAFFLTLVGIGFLLANPIANQVRTFTNNLPHIASEANKTLANLQSWLEPARHPRGVHQAGQDRAAEHPGQSRQERRLARLLRRRAADRNGQRDLRPRADLRALRLHARSTASASGGSCAGRCPTATARRPTTIRRSSSTRSPATSGASCCSAS